MHCAVRGEGRSLEANAAGYDRKIGEQVEELPKLV